MSEMTVKKPPPSTERKFNPRAIKASIINTISVIFTMCGLILLSITELQVLMSGVAKSRGFVVGKRNCQFAQIYNSSRIFDYKTCDPLCLTFVIGRCTSIRHLSIMSCSQLPHHIDNNYFCLYRLAFR